MKGIEVLLQSVLRALKINVDPTEVEKAFGQAKDALPRLAAVFEDIQATQKRIEQKLDALRDSQSGTPVFGVESEQPNNG